MTKQTQNQSTDQLTPLLTHSLDATLGTPAAVTALQTQLANVPLLSGGLLECRLTDEADAIDLGMLVTEADGGFDFLSAPFQTISKPDSAVAQQAWAAIQTFATIRNDAANPLHAAVKEAWLEFDTQSAQPAAPSFFFKLADSHARPALLGKLAETTQAQTLSVIQTGLTALGYAPSAEANATLQRCIAHRPAPSCLTFVGCLLGREQPGFRITLDHVPIRAVTGYLKQIGWTHDHEALLASLRMLKQHTQSIQLNIDIDDTPQPTLGFEVSFAGDAQAEARWQALLTQLAQHRLADPAHGAALLDWVGQDAPDSADWPADLSAQLASVTRNVNHVKLTVDPSVELPQQFVPTTVTRRGGIREIEMRPKQGLPTIGEQVGRAVSAKAYLSFHYQRR